MALDNLNGNSIHLMNTGIIFRKLTFLKKLINIHRFNVNNNKIED